MTKHILATTYAVNPYKGSEDGMGWNFVMQIARFHKVTAVTRENNRPHIERYMSENPSPSYENIRFLYFDLPYWMRFWKKGSRGAMLYYWMWQKGVVSFIRKQDIRFDLVHNLNFHNDWTPSYLWKLGKPFVWGPVGHHPLIPGQYLKPYRRSYLVKDRLTWMVKNYFWKYSRSLRRTVSKADYIWCMNESVPGVLNLKNDRYCIMPSVATDDFGYEENKQAGRFTLISAGRLVPLKGYDLGIHAFATFLQGLAEDEKQAAELVIIGSGPEKDYYKELAASRGITTQVRFIEWMDRRELMDTMRNASAFLFPSHEGAGMVVAEALSFGLPVLCLDNCGPGEFIDASCGVAVPLLSYPDTVKGLADGIDKLYRDRDLLERMRIAARRKFMEKFHWDRRGEQLDAIYQSLGA